MVRSLGRSSPARLRWIEECDLSPRLGETATSAQPTRARATDRGARIMVGSLHRPWGAFVGLTPLSAGLPKNPGGWPCLPGTNLLAATLPTGCAGRNEVAVVAWSDMREGSCRLYYRRTSDGGGTWQGEKSGDRLLGNAIPAGFHHFNPQLVSQSDGHLGCAFFELGPKNKTGTLLIDVGLSRSSDDAVSFGPPVIVTDQPWDPAASPYYSVYVKGPPQLLGTGFGLDGHAGWYYPLWPDSRTGIPQLFTALPKKFRPAEEEDCFAIIYLLFGIIMDGDGGYRTSGGRLPPGDPGPGLREILTAMAVFKTAEKMRGPEKNSIQIQTLNTIIRVAQARLKDIPTDPE